jgi:hypothetical protein
MHTAFQLQSLEPKKRLLNPFLHKNEIHLFRISIGLIRSIFCETPTSAQTRGSLSIIYNMGRSRPTVKVHCSCRGQQLPPLPPTHPSRMLQLEDDFDWPNSHYLNFVSTNHFMFQEFLHQSTIKKLVQESY